MSSSIKYVFVALLGYVAWYYAKLYEASKLLSFSVGLPSKFNADGDSFDFQQVLKVTNGSTRSIPINSASVKNKILGVEVGTTILSGTTIIKPLQTTDLVFNVSIPYTDILPLVGGTIGAIKSKKFNIQFIGRVWAAGLPLSVDSKYGIDLATIIK